MKGENIERRLKDKEGSNPEIDKTTEKLKEMAESVEKPTNNVENAAEVQDRDEGEQLKQALSEAEETFEDETEGVPEQEYPANIAALGEEIMEETEEIEHQKENTWEIKLIWKQLKDFFSGRTKKWREKFKDYARDELELSVMSDEDVRMMEKYKLTPEEFRDVSSYMTRQRLKRERIEHPERFDPGTGRPLSLREQGFSIKRFLLGMSQKKKE